MTRHLKILSLLAASVLSANFQCQDDIEPEPPAQTFDMPVRLYPARKVYALGDTIWLETDVPDKFLLDTKAGQKVNVDSAQFDFRATFNRFGTQVTNPPEGFCDVITAAGVNTNRELAHWATSGTVNQVGCGQPDYRVRIGFRLKVPGTYAFALQQDQYLGSCSGKAVPYYAGLAFRFQNADLNLDVLEAPAAQGGVTASDDSAVPYYREELRQGRAFIVRVE